MDETGRRRLSAGDRRREVRHYCMRKNRPKQDTPTPKKNAALGIDSVPGGMNIFGGDPGKRALLWEGALTRAVETP